MKRKLPAYTVYLILSGGMAFFFTLWGFITGIYRVEDVGLTPFQLIMLGTALELTVLLFEVPTGIVADLRSRRLSVLIGYVIIGIGFIVEGSLPFFCAGAPGTDNMGYRLHLHQWGPRCLVSR